MSIAISPSTNRRYGVAMVSRLWRIARATVYRHRNPSSSSSLRSLIKHKAMSQRTVGRGSASETRGTPPLNSPLMNRGLETARAA